MAIEFNCPHCGKLLTTSDERAGARAKCPACGDLITVPALQSTAGVASPAFTATAPWSADAPHASSSASLEATGAWSSTPSIDPHRGIAPVPSVPGQSPARRPQPAFCVFCGARIDPEASHCPNCGGPRVALTPRFQYAAYWRRAFALVLDSLLIIGGSELVALITPQQQWFSLNLWFAVGFVYYAAFESSSARATLGKRLLGIAVCGSDGRRLSLPRAGIRTFAKIGSLLICGVGFLMPLLTPRSQALHDLLTDSVVIRK